MQRRTLPSLHPACRRTWRASLVACTVALGASLSLAPLLAAGPAGTGSPGGTTTDLFPHAPKALPRLGPGGAPLLGGALRSDASRIRWNFDSSMRFGALASGMTRSFAPSNLSAELLDHMQREAERYQAGHLYDVSGALAPVDSFSEDLRAREAERIILRALNRTVDMKTDAVARSTGGLGAALEWLEGLGSTDARARARRSDGFASGAGVREAARFRGSVGLKVGSHPSFVFGGALGKFRGRVEVPLLGEPVRLSLERPLGPHGRAVLSSGLPHDGRQWAALSLSLRF